MGKDTVPSSLFALREGLSWLAREEWLDDMFVC